MPNYSPCLQRNPRHHSDVISRVLPQFCLTSSSLSFLLPDYAVGFPNSPHSKLICTVRHGTGLPSPRHHGYFKHSGTFLRGAPGFSVSFESCMYLLSKLALVSLVCRQRIGYEDVKLRGLWRVKHGWSFFPPPTGHFWLPN